MSVKTLLKLVTLLLFCYGVSALPTQNAYESNIRLSKQQRTPQRQFALRPQTFTSNTNNRLAHGVPSRTNDMNANSYNRDPRVLRPKMDSKYVTYWKKIGSKSDIHVQRQEKMNRNMKLAKDSKRLKSEAEAQLNDYLNDAKPFQKRIKGEIDSYTNILKDLGRRKNKIRKQARKNKQLNKSLESSKPELDKIINRLNTKAAHKQIQHEINIFSDVLSDIGKGRRESGKQARRSMQTNSSTQSNNEPTSNTINGPTVAANDINQSDIQKTPRETQNITPSPTANKALDAVQSTFSGVKNADFLTLGGLALTIGAYAKKRYTKKYWKEFKDLEDELNILNLKRAVQRKQMQSLGLCEELLGNVLSKAKTLDERMEYSLEVRINSFAEMDIHNNRDILQSGISNVKRKLNNGANEEEEKEENDEKKDKKVNKKAKLEEEDDTVEKPNKNSGLIRRELMQDLDSGVDSEVPVEDQGKVDS